MLTNDRDQARRMFSQAWSKRLTGKPLEPMEAIIADVVADHPEYHPYLGNDADSLNKDFPPELGRENPFMHMGMHIAIREQISIDRPSGILSAHKRLALKTGDPHKGEHEIMECLGQALWEAQRAGTAPDESIYLSCVQKRAQ